MLISYTYDAWGNFTTGYYSSGANTTAAKNPITYRGYYYDSDLELYYLQSRYYDSNTCRFINADIMISGTNGSLHGFNLYAYCFNNPVMMTDSEGNWPEWLQEKIDYFNSEAQKLYNSLVATYESAKEVAKKLYDDYSNAKGNKSEQVVLDANYFSMYNGTFVLKVPGEFGMSFGFIILGNTNSTKNDVKHEYGHKLQLENSNILDYTMNVALPSLTAYFIDSRYDLPFDYYSSPWEAEADRLGGVKRSTFEDPWTKDDGYYKYIIDIFKGG